MNLDQKTIRTRGHSRARHRRNLVPTAGSMRRIGDDRKMRQLFDHRNRGDIERVSGVVLERSDAAFAKDYVAVAACHDVFRRQQPLLDRRGRPALQKNRTPHLRQFFQQIEVLHVPGADLKYVDMLQKHGNLRLIHDFGNHNQAVLVRRVTQDPQTFFAHALKAVWRCSRFEGSAAKNLDSVFLHDPGDGHNLLRALHRARSGHHDNVAPANFSLAAGGSDLHHGPFGFERPARQLV